MNIIEVGSRILMSAVLPLVVISADSKPPVSADINESIGPCASNEIYQEITRAVCKSSTLACSSIEDCQKDGPCIIQTVVGNCIRVEPTPTPTSNSSIPCPPGQSFIMDFNGRSCVVHL